MRRAERSPATGHPRWRRSKLRGVPHGLPAHPGALLATVEQESRGQPALMAASTPARKHSTAPARCAATRFGPRAPNACAGQCLGLLALGSQSRPQVAEGLVDLHAHQAVLLAVRSSSFTRSRIGPRRRRAAVLRNAASGGGRPGPSGCRRRPARRGRVRSKGWVRRPPRGELGEFVERPSNVRPANRTVPIGHSDGGRALQARLERCRQDQVRMAEELEPGKNVHLGVGERRTEDLPGRGSESNTRFGPKDDASVRGGGARADRDGPAPQCRPRLTKGFPPWLVEGCPEFRGGGKLVIHRTIMAVRPSSVSCRKRWGW